MRPTLAIESRMTTTRLLLSLITVLGMLLLVRRHVTGPTLLPAVLLTLLSETSDLVNAFVAGYARVHSVAHAWVLRGVLCCIGLSIWAHYRVVLVHWAVHTLMGEHAT